MEGNKNKPRALLLFGAPCSGKTTFGQRFAEKYHLAYYNFDELAEEYKFSREVILIILEQILKTNQNIIFEGGLNTEKQRMEVRNTIRNSSYEPALIWIQTDIATIRNRLKNKFRSVKKAREFYDSAIKAIEAPAETEHAIILSGKHTFETQSRHVLAGLAGMAVEQQKKKAKKINLG
jgi:shikimate kinase